MLDYFYSRINTIISYDRVLVMEKGQVDSFDTPAALYAAGGIFYVSFWSAVTKLCSTDSFL